MTADPFAPAHQPIPPRKSRESVDHMQAINFVFENDNWFVNVLWVALAILSGGIVPIVGQLAIQGYQFAIIEALHMRPHEKYPDFNFDLLGDYLMTGLWVFLVTLVVAIITVPITLVLVFAAIALIGGGMAVGGEEAAGIVAIVTIPLIVMISIVFAVAINMFMVPFVLRAGLTKNFGEAFDFGWAMEFIKNTWVQMFISGIIFVIALLVLQFVGLLMACVGVYFTIAIGMFMQAHLGLQLYEIHLSRGGRPVHIRPVGEMNG